MMARALGARTLIGMEVSDYRLALARNLGLADYLFKPDTALEEIRRLTGGKGVEKAVDTSANDSARRLAIQATRSWGKIAFVGEGGTVHFEPSPDIIHGQKTIYGSWVTSLWRMEDLVERLVRWGIHPEALVTHRFPLEQRERAYRLMAEGSAVRLPWCSIESGRRANRPYLGSCGFDCEIPFLRRIRSRVDSKGVPDGFCNGEFARGGHG